MMVFSIFVLKIPIKRVFVPEAEAYIFEALEWLGIAPDETVSARMKNLDRIARAKEKKCTKNMQDQFDKFGLGLLCI